MNNDISQYSDIISLEPPVSAARRRMSRHDRAAQFSPFAALTGYEDVLSETARLTDERAELSEDEQAALNARLLILEENISERPEAVITFFVPDGRKRGGEYRTESGAVKRIDEAEMTVIFADGRQIPIADIYRIDGELFRRIEGITP